MKLSSILAKDLIVLNLRSSAKKEALNELVDLICVHYKQLNKEQIMNAIMSRKLLRRIRFIFSNSSASNGGSSGAFTKP